METELVISMVQENTKSPAVFPIQNFIADLFSLILVVCDVVFLGFNVCFQSQRYLNKCSFDIRCMCCTRGVSTAAKLGK